MRRLRLKGSTKEIREETHLTRPPRLEGVVKEAKMLPKRKLKKQSTPEEKK